MLSFIKYQTKQNQNQTTTMPWNYQCNQRSGVNNQERSQRYVCKKGTACHRNPHNPAICYDMLNYYIQRSFDCLEIVLDHLFHMHIKSNPRFEEHEMAAWFDYLLSTPVQRYLNASPCNAAITYFRQEINCLLGYYAEHPPTNNKFASDLAEMKVVLNVEPGVLDPELRTLSDKSSDILYPFTAYPIGNQEYTLYAYDELGEPCENAIEEKTCYYHVMLAATVWDSYLDENENVDEDASLF